MNSRALALVLVTLIARNPPRDDADSATLAALERTLAERADLVRERAERELELAAVRKERSRFISMSNADLLAMAGTDARVIADRAESFFRVVTIARAGDELNAASPRARPALTNAYISFTQRATANFPRASLSTAFRLMALTSGMK